MPWSTPTPSNGSHRGKRPGSAWPLITWALARETDDHAVLNAERPHLLAALSDAHRREDWETTLRFAAALDDWLDLQGHWMDWVTVLRQALDAARTMSDQLWETEPASTMVHGPTGVHRLSSPPVECW